MNSLIEYPNAYAGTDNHTLASMISGRDNGLNFLRLFLALLVIVDHSFPLGGYGEDPMWLWSKHQDSLGGIAVAGFFAISGYLITKSSISSDVLQFFWRRILRIFPAYWIVLILTAWVVAPVLWWVDGKEWMGFINDSDCGPSSYVPNNWMLDIGQYCINDLFATTTPYGLQVKASVFNGSLWTLIYEWHCYVLVGVLGLFGVLRKAKLLVVAIAIWLYLLMMLQIVFPDFPGKVISWFDGIQTVHTIRLTSIFMIGSVAALYADRLAIDDRLGSLAGLMFGYSLLNGGYYVIGYPCLVYLILWLAVRLPKSIKQIGLKNDYSYGVYIYGFLVQQVLAHYGFNKYGTLSYIMMTTVVSMLLAVASWHLIEKPALGLKDIGPGRGIGYWWDALNLIKRSDRYGA